jgi:hypothetical protein
MLECGVIWTGRRADMISFASLLLGLVFGIVEVELVAAPGVVRVELLLDGTRVAEVRRPWQAVIDLGHVPAPHELVAVAFDSKGEEVGRARQWINLLPALAEASFTLEPGTGGRGRIARLVWRSLTSDAPTSIAVTFDGAPLPVADPGRIELPPHVPEQVHFLRAELGFERNVTAVADATFGGRRNEEALKEMTAVPILLNKGVSLPPVEQLGGWFVGEGPLQVAAVEEGPKEVIFVCELYELGRFSNRQVGRGRYTEVPLGKDVRFRFVSPEVQTVELSMGSTNLFRITPYFSQKDGGIRDVARRRLFGNAMAKPTGQRIADAVATAAISATEQRRRSAVVLVAGQWNEDESTLTAQEAEAFLETMRVPLLVWVIGEKPGEVASEWTTATRITSEQGFLSALSALEASLDRQRIVWVEGTHLPQAIALGPAAKGIRLAR